MPPLTTPATAVLFMIGFFVVMMGAPLLALWLGHRHWPRFSMVGHSPGRGHKLILPE